ncbi:hypothetical protein BST14_18615 [Mycobacterium arosiense ATCC BAA-1401 = DSM 45069]|uniref:Probable cytochrome c oxidase subunit 3 n=1 Tax=Mycobacterium arosiense ATCC BAA-1401 = DSM 45069 TaxID=1265311 RepID=A0A1W9ZCP7_MYCAI|nr:hypothetical protein BST14_18615 [Mycobacterium arosiense ATCC BAA-1401 = DSM 45069]
MTLRHKAASEAHTRSPQTPGESGVWVFILGEMTVFSALFVVIVCYRAAHAQMFAASQHALNRQLGLVNTIVLIIGSVLVVSAVHAVQQTRFHSAAGYLAAAMTCGSVFAIIKAIEYVHLLHRGAWIHTNEYWMLFFAITGAHLLHVAVGCTVLALARHRIRAGLRGPRDVELCISATCYWHMVDLVWLVLFPLFYLVN